MTLPEKKYPEPLLIVDDRADVLRALERFMSLYFECVLVAQTPPEAEALLEKHAPHYLLCDYWLGEEYPPATSFIPQWRTDFPCLRRVVLMTGTKSSSIVSCDQVDRVLQKPLNMEKLVGFFTTSL